ncbi:hypothetical protein PG997_002202 [Apiospora hydei]|uniref:Uncharacterized protein n=1 Tax=Apiospora hydei TaxID=1337664 RepID=A0ABR1X8P7_9PEZI
MGNGNCNKTCSQLSSNTVASSINVTFSWDVGSHERERGLPPVGALKKFAHKARLPLLLVSLQQCLAKKSQSPLGKTPNKVQKKLKEAVERRRGKRGEEAPLTTLAMAAPHDDFFMVQKPSKGDFLQRRRPTIGFVPRVIAKTL